MASLSDTVNGESGACGVEVRGMYDEVRRRQLK
jgi:hypothetical protein